MEEKKQREIKKTKEKKTKSFNLKILWTIIIVLILILLIVALYFAFNYYYQDKILPRTYLGDIKLGNLSQDVALSRITTQTDNLDESGLTYSYQDTEYTIYPTVILSESTLEMIEFDNQATIDLAFSYGHSGTWLENLKSQIQNIVLKHEIELDFYLDQDLLSQELETYFKILEDPAINADLVYDTETSSFSVSDKQNGTTFNYDEIISQTDKDLKTLNTKDYSLSSIIDKAKIDKQTVTNFITRVDEITKLMPFDLTYEENVWDIDENLIKQIISVKEENDKFYLGIDKTKATDMFSNLSSHVYVETLDGKFTMENNKVTEFQGSQQGKTLNINKSIKGINKALTAEATTAELIVDITNPLVPVGSLNDLGIKEIIGSGESNYYGSSSARIHNVETGAMHLHGLLIAPGEEFTTIGNLTPISRANGYLSELVIKGNQTIPELGGGLCQIGTTMFRVASNSGLPITSRRSHSYQVSYYDPVGFDATIYDPNPDLKFINDTGHYILIQAVLDIHTRYIRFEFWGTSDNRTSKMSAIRYWGRTSAPATIYHETTDLAPGQKSCSENAIPGLKAAFDRTVTYADGTVMNDTFESTYKAWAAVCRIGVEPEAEIEEETPVETNTNVNTNKNSI